ncbi:MAG: aldehyde dehydrogenase family protein [Gammaproteobacteria bacterium]
MKDYLQFYIDGQWVDPAAPRTLDVIDPSTEQPCAKISLGGAADVDRAVKAARTAFATFGRTTREQRLALLEAIIAEYKKRIDEMAQVICAEMGAPMWFARAAQAPTGEAHFSIARKVLQSYEFEVQKQGFFLRKEPIGVCGLITPWNWPINQIACKVAPALAAGCTMVLKPSEVAPLSACLLAEILHAAGVPKGVFNLVNGDGPTVGTAISSHPDVDMVSFTGSTRAGIQVAKAAADTVKRVAQELGGKSANIVLEDADLQKAVSSGVVGCFANTGQSCNAPTRMFVPRARHDEALAIARTAAERVKPGAPNAEGRPMGPVVSEVQFKRVQALIQKGIDEGATLVTGGTGRPQDLPRGYYVRPTIFGNVRNDMTIAREEIFGPVLCILPYDSEDQAIEMANDSAYGLSAYVQSGSIDHARAVAARIRSGNVHINGAPTDFGAPFGGYKQSGNGREWGDLGIEEYLETKAVLVPKSA